MSSSPTTAVPAALERVAGRCRTDPALAATCCLLAAVDGVEVAAHDLHGHGLDNPAETIASVTKSLLSSLVGHALDQGALELGTTLGELLGGRVPGPRRSATVHQLLTMTSGAAGGLLEIDAVMELPGGWVEELLAAEQLDEPGTRFRYDNGTWHLLAAGLQQAVGGDLLGWARSGPLAAVGAADVEWPVDPDGVPYGFGDARLSPRALLALGEAWRTGTGVPGWYRERAWRAWTPGGPPEHRGYGYGWWVGADAGEATRLAAGWAGQAVLVAPGPGLCVVATGCPSRWREGSTRPVLAELAEVVAASRDGRS
ncbi:serine hydrolase domain-containing protein [Auraticoccus cholistanensis]|uniref:serine hydrolase domain-containing protein n=1 Tax=Auraticoccus cholistanensis TaxID=2656650 RepID=UPI0012E722EB